MAENIIKKSNLRTWIEVDRQVLLDNNNAIKSHLPKGTEIMAIIKADGYGHGAEMVAETLSPYVEAFGVATASEAIALRQSGIENDILILGGSFDCDYPDIIEYGITPTVFTYESALELSKAANGKPAPCFIAVDTGMGRIGFQCDENGIDAVLKIASLDGIKITGIFSHIACADEKNKDSAKKQIVLFEGFLNNLKEIGIDYGKASISNSAAIMELNPKFDIVREGIILYGVYPSKDVDTSVLDVKPVLSLKTRIEYIKKVPKGTAISYGQTFVTEKETTVATVYCGYADGYPRTLSNKGHVLVGGKFAPIIGRICMDQFMIDVSDIPDLKINDVVTLIGKDGDKEITVTEIADMAGTIPYEILTGLAKPRITRVYK